MLAAKNDADAAKNNAKETPLEFAAHRQSVIIWSMARI